jgi:hypothetical protein
MMKFLGLPNINWRPLRLLIAVFCCTFLLFSSGLTALAASNPDQGVMPLKSIEQKSKKALQSEPRSLEEVQAEAKKGTNGVQGSADRDKMKNPSNADSDATSVEEQVSDVLSDLTGKGK